MQRENMKFFAIAIVTAFGLLLATVPLANAQNAFQCTGTIADGRTIDSNLVVPANKSCELDNVRVAGNVHVGTGATLNALPGSGQTVTIGGNIVADHCGGVELNSQGGTISVEGNVTIRNCMTPNSYFFGGLVVQGNLRVDSNNSETGGYFFAGLVVQGNLSVDNNNAGPGNKTLILQSNQVSGNVDLSDNSAGVPPFVDGNKISGNLLCSGNSPPPVGASNTVGGREQGQCAALPP